MENMYNNKLENDYSVYTNIEHRRSLGQFFTPFKVACFMADWILDNPSSNLSILDPAAGLGVFERAINYRNEGKKLYFDLWEIDENIASQLSHIIDTLDLNSNINNSDFLTGTWGKKYDGIIANPPYYKHHFIKNKNNIYQNICCKTYFKFSIQTNIYCWFLIKSINLLRNNGKLAFIVPSEYLNANFGEKIKEYLLSSGVVLHLININFKENVFDNAITTSSIILAQKSPNPSVSMNFYNVFDVKHLDDLNSFLETYPRKVILNNDLDPKTKWYLF
jgi:adenine-specific DNA-methyltransferase